MAKERRA